MIQLQIFFRRIVTPAICALTMLIYASCTQWIDPSVNINPDNPADVPMKLLLPGVEVSAAYLMGGDISRYNGIWMQQYQGVDRQFANYNNYQMTADVFNNVWGSAYISALTSAGIIIEKAEKEQSPHYSGMAKILTALIAGVITDHFGDVPFSEALQGKNTGNFIPKYDKQQDIYTSIQRLLDEGITELGATQSRTSPSSDDIIYGGDRQKWIRAATTLKARYWLHLSKIDQSSAARALSAATSTNALRNNADDFRLVFETTPTSENPLSQFLAQRAGLITIGGRLVAMMNMLNDPRRAAFFTTDAAGGYSTNSLPGTLYASKNSAVPMITFTEQKFIEAEAQFRAGNATAAKAAFTQAIRASLTNARVSDADANAYIERIVPSGNVSLQNIIEQKYIALFTQSEVFTDWRRTGFPNIIPPTTAQGVTPRRYLYPQSEFNFNSTNVPQNVTLQMRVWWDSE